MNASKTPTSIQNNIEHQTLVMKPIEKICFRNDWQSTINGVINNPKYAQEFFFYTPEKGTLHFCPDYDHTAHKVMISLTNQVNKTYGLDLDIQDVQTFIYLGLWQEGSWARVKTYAYRSDFLKWLTFVGSQVLHKRLVDDDVIRIHSNPNGNYRLRLLSQPYDIRVDVVNLMSVKHWHDLLYDFYVLKLPQQEIQANHHLSDDEYKERKKSAEDKLITLLLDTHEGNVYADIVLSLKQTAEEKIDIVSIDSVNHYALTTDDEQTPVSQFFKSIGIDPDGFNVITFAIDFIKTRLKWRLVDIDLWRDRFFFNVSPVEIAERIGRSRAYVDTRFNQLKRAFNNAIRAWWATENYELSLVKV